MQLDPGPIPPLPTGWYDQTLDDPGFGSLAAQAIADIDAELSLFDAAIDPAVLILDALPDDGSYAEIDAIDQSNGNCAPLAGPWQIPPMEDQWTAVSASVIDVFQNIPAEAWEDVPGATDYGGGTAPPTFAGIPGITFSNTTSPQYGDFVEGDSYTIVIQLPTQGQLLNQYYNVDVTLYPNKDNVAQPAIDLGKTDLNGTVTYVGQWQPGDAGAWGGTFYTTTSDGAEIAGPTTYWTVLPAGSTNRQSTGQVVTVRLTNTSAPGYRDFSVGDAWDLEVYGPPASDIIISGTFNGNPLTPQTLGQTDPNGHFQKLGSMSEAELGNWTEVYSVAGFQSPDVQTFRVIE